MENIKIHFTKNSFKFFEHYTSKIILIESIEIKIREIIKSIKLILLILLKSKINIIKIIMMN